MTSTVEKGNNFRDQILRIMSAAGYEVEGPEARANHIKADAATWTKRDAFGDVVKVLIEAKDYDGNLPKPVVESFISNYLSLVQSGQYGQAWLISRGSITPDARQMVNGYNGLKAFDYATLQRRLFNVDKIIEAHIRDYKEQEVDAFYEEPNLADGTSLQKYVEQWLEIDNALPLAIVGGYGTGKTTFAYHLANMLAKRSQDDLTKRVPIRIPLADVYDDQSMEGLFGKVLVSGTARVENYHYALFEELNKAGRFVLIFDGFDEMKHGITFTVFERNVNRILQLDVGRSKIIVLGRDTALHDEHEFRAVIKGEQRTLHGTPVKSEIRRSFDPLSLADFTQEQAHRFVRNFFPAQVKRLRPDAQDPIWVNNRVSELTNHSFDELLYKPVHAKMLCQVATQPEVDLSEITSFTLYDLFVHHLLERESRKTTRLALITRDDRRRFNSMTAWWMWENGTASTTTLGTIPASLITQAMEGVVHGLTDESLRRELSIGLLVQKGEGDIIYFSHRSIQEFLVAEELYARDLFQSSILSVVDLRKVTSLLNEVIIDFLMQRLEMAIEPSTARRWMEYLNRLTGPALELRWIELFRQMYNFLPIGAEDVPAHWAPVLSYATIVGSCEIKLTSNSSDLLIRSLLGVQNSKNLREQAATIMIATKYIRETGDRSVLASLMTVLLDQDSIEKVEANALAPIGAQDFLLRRDVDLCLYLFAKCVTVHRNENRVQYLSVNLSKIEGETMQVAEYGFVAGESKNDVVEILSLAVLNVADQHQRIIGGRTEKAARRFLRADVLRQKLAPLVVKTVSSVKIAEPQRPVLTLPGKRKSAVDSGLVRR